MSKRLSDEDRRAVDFLLDRDNASQNGDGSGSSPGAASGHGEFKQRLQRVHETLQLLDQLPAPEPSANLVMNVFARIDEANLHRAAGRAGAAHPVAIRPTA